MGALHAEDQQMEKDEYGMVVAEDDGDYGSSEDDNYDETDLVSSKATSPWRVVVIFYHTRPSFLSCRWLDSSVAAAAVVASVCIG